MQRQAGDPNFRGERFSNATHRSRTDPEARLYKKGPHQEAFPRYLGHYVVDKDTRIILAVAASQAYGRAELEVARALLAQLKAGPYLTDTPWVYLDRGYRAGHFLADLLELGYLPCVRQTQHLSRCRPGNAAPTAWTGRAVAAKNCGPP
jgi:hypothetical protein